PRIYFLTASSSRPTVLTQYPVAQKCRPVIRRSRSSSQWIRTALFPFREPTVYDTLYFGGILTNRWIWSAAAVPPAASPLSARTTPARSVPPTSAADRTESCGGIFDEDHMVFTVPLDMR